MHGIGHVEIPTTNVKKAQKFFGNIFGWTFQEVPDLDRVLFHTGSAPGGSLLRVKKMPKKGQVNVYIEVEDVAAKLKEIKKAKGKVLVKKTPVGTMGWLGQCATPDGCFLSLWQSAPKEQAEGEPIA